MRSRKPNKIICFLLILILLSVGLFAVFTITTHHCADCVQATGLCPYHAKLVGDLSQFVAVFSAVACIALVLALTVIVQFLEKHHNRTLVMWKVRMNS